MKLLKSIKHQTLQPGPKAMSFNRLSLSLHRPLREFNRLWTQQSLNPAPTWCHHIKRLDMLQRWETHWRPHIERLDLLQRWEGLSLRKYLGCSAVETQFQP
jgi:hypothetical protein